MSEASLYLGLRRLSACEADAAVVQQVLQAAPVFALMTQGKLSAPDEGKQELLALPPGKQAQDKFFFALEDAKGRVLGCADLIRGYPEPEIAYLGLLLLVEEVQGLGYGSQAMLQLRQLACDWGCNRLRLGVVEQNVAGRAFWQRQGFVEIARKTLPHLIGTVLVMEADLR